MRGDARADSSLLCSFTLKKFLFAVALFNCSRPRLARHTRVRARRELPPAAPERRDGRSTKPWAGAICRRRDSRRTSSPGNNPRADAHGGRPPLALGDDGWTPHTAAAGLGGRRRVPRPARRRPTPDRSFRSTTRSRERERLAASVRSAPRRRATSPGSRRFMCGNQPVVREVEYARIEVGLNIRRWRP